MLKPLVDALGAWTPRDRGTAHEDPLRLLAAGWPDIVGEDVARNSCPTRLVAGTLTITTRSGAWSQQLSFLSERIVAAARARVSQTKIDQLRFRVGNVREASAAALHPAGEAGAAAVVRARRRKRVLQASTPAATAHEALARFRATVSGRRRAKEAAGWKECRGCEALIAPGSDAFCTTCANAREEARTAAVARLLFEAPWLGYAGTAALIEGLTTREYESVRARLLSRWWEALSRARFAKKLSRDGRERLIASSYVLLKSRLAPEEIAPATIRNVLGDEIHDLIYGMERTTKTNVE